MIAAYTQVDNNEAKLQIPMHENWTVTVWHGKGPLTKIVYLFTLSVCKLPRVHMRSYASTFEKFGRKIQTFSIMLIKCDCVTFHTVLHLATDRRCFSASNCTPPWYSLYTGRSSPDFHIYAELHVHIQRYVEEN